VSPTSTQRAGSTRRQRLSRAFRSTPWYPAGSPTENLHVAFEATDNATVDAFHRELTAAGYRDNGRPGERDYHPGYYGAFVLDPDGNNAEVVNHNS
jgi:catechol 2,3-dioxygenase-like lactoylglutathione lyase family enzyme